MSDACVHCLARRGTVCGALDDRQLERLFALAGTVRITAGSWLVRPGDRADRVYLLRAGHAHVSRVTRDGKRQILAFLFPGDFFAFTHEPRYVFGAYAATDLALCIERIGEPRADGLALRRSDHVARAGRSRNKDLARLDRRVRCAS
ncbi:MAG: cyclic nucleotide-binding domain-containing protein [Steroidobacteraceae bacterium]|nr:cyclic nucleotide-binding domain-containing protein [Steroidobacteraceae bacterium]MDW8259074.1 cyclic nucleotide-binding domain-containing protein [Gammaproteobacteria bacterium]